MLIQPLSHTPCSLEKNLHFGKHGIECIFWIYPSPTRNSYHQDYYIFSREYWILINLYLPYCYCMGVVDRVDIEPCVFPWMDGAVGTQQPESPICLDNLLLNQQISWEFSFIYVRSFFQVNCLQISSFFVHACEASCCVYTHTSSEACRNKTQGSNSC